MLNLLPITDSCVRGPVGIAAIYFIDAAQVRGLTFNLFDRITSIQLAPGASLLRADFEVGAANFTQNLQREEDWPRVTQGITFENDGVQNQVIRALKRLSEHCDLHVIVSTNGGQNFYMGISYYADRDYLWDSGNCILQQGSVNMDRPGGSMRTVSTLQATARNYAPEIEADITLLPITEPPPPDPEVDNAAPVAIAFVPADDAVGVSISPACWVDFNEAVVPLTGNVVLKNWDTDATVLILDVTDPAEVEFDPAQARMVLKLGTLDYATRYYFEIPATAVADQAGNPWAGIAAKGDWDFTTEDEPPAVPPALLTLTPADDSTGVDPTGLFLIIELNQQVQAGVGNLLVFDNADDSLVLALDVNQAAILNAAASWDVSGLLSPNSHYYLHAPVGLLENTSGLAWAGITTKGDWSFETNDTAPPGVLTYFPANLDLSAPATGTIYIDLDEVVQLGASGVIQLVQFVDGTGLAGNDILFHSWDLATTADVVLDNGDTRVNFTNAPARAYSVLYYMIIPVGCIIDAAGNSLPRHNVGELGAVSWLWQTAAQLTASLVPVNGESNHNCGINPSLNTGFVRVFTASNSTWLKVFDYDTDVLIWANPLYAFGDQRLTAQTAFFAEGNPRELAYWDGDEVVLYNVPAQAGQRIYIIFESDAIVDPIHGQEINGLPKAKGDWEFTWAALQDPVLPPSSTSPPSGGTFAVLTEGDLNYIQLEITLSDNAYPVDMFHSGSAKYIRFTDYDTAVEVYRISAADRRNLFAFDVQRGEYGGTSWRILVPGDVLSDEAKYNVTIDAGFFETRCGAASSALAAGDWTIEGENYVAPPNTFDFMLDNLLS